MRHLFKMHWSLKRAIEEDLLRPHEFALERVGFIGCRAAHTNEGTLVLGTIYLPVVDDCYCPDESVGARIDGTALRAAMQLSLNERVGIFHVHAHSHFGVPAPSLTDRRESAKFIPDFFNVTPSMPHGTVILSHDSASGSFWIGKEAKPTAFTQIVFTGAPIRIMEQT